MNTQHNIVSLLGTAVVIPLLLQGQTRPPIQAPSRVRLVLAPSPESTTVDTPTLEAIAQVLQRRLDASGVRRASARVHEGRVEVEASNVTDLERLEALVTQRGRLEFRITDMQNRFRDVLPELDRLLARAGFKSRAAPASGISQLFGQQGNAELSGPLSGILWAGQMPGQFLVAEPLGAYAESLLTRPELVAALPNGVGLRWGKGIESRGGQRYRALYALEEPILTQRELSRARARRDVVNDHSVVIVDLTVSGRRMFCEQTSRHVHDYLAIVVENQVQDTPPIITDAICGDAAQIDLQKAPLDHARQLAAVMTGGELAAPVVLVDVSVLESPSAETGRPVVLGVIVLALIGLVILLSSSRREPALAAGTDATPAAPVLDSLASLGDRLAGQFLDSIVVIVILIVTFVAQGAMDQTPSGTFGDVTITIGILLALFYLLMADGFRNGQSYGKRIMKTAVVDAGTGAPCTFGQSLVRNLLLSILGVFDWIFIFGRRRQRLGDKAAGTLVVKTIEHR